MNVLLKYYAWIRSREKDVNFKCTMENLLTKRYNRETTSQINTWATSLTHVPIAVLPVNYHLCKNSCVKSHVKFSVVNILLWYNDGKFVYWLDMSDICSYLFMSILIEENLNNFISKLLFIVKINSSVHSFAVVYISSEGKLARSKVMHILS